jgi:hypothetical protein
LNRTSPKKDKSLRIKYGLHKTFVFKYGGHFAV